MEHHHTIGNIDEVTKLFYKQLGKLWKCPLFLWEVGMLNRSIQFFILFVILLSALVLKADKNTDLIECCKNGDFECVKELVKKGADVNAIDIFGTPVIHLAAQKGNAELVKYLLNLCSKNVIKQKGHLGRNILHSVAMSRNIDLIKYILSLNICNIQEKDDWKFTMLYYAIEKGDFEIVNYLINIGLLIDNQGYITQAINTKNIDLVKLIVENSKISIDVNSAFRVASGNLQFNIMQYFENFRNNEINYSDALLEATDEGGYGTFEVSDKTRITISEYLLKKGADVNFIDSYNG